MGYGWDILSVANVTRMMQETQDVLTLPMALKWYERTAKRNVSDEELTAKFKDYWFAADIVAADSKALIRDAGEFSFEQHRIAKLKHGFGISESMVQLLKRIEAGKAMDNELLGFRSYVASRARNLLIGIRQRAETMIIGALLDEFSYDRLGIKIDGTFGMPNDLKIVPSTPWTTAGSATPIKNIIDTIVYARRKYGESYNRVTISYEAMQKIVATTEFQDIYKANAFVYAVASNAITSRAANPLYYRQFLANYIAGSLNDAGNDGGGQAIEIEIYDGQYREASTASTINDTVPFHPAHMVLLTNSADDNGSTGWEWGNGIVIESVLGRMGGTSVIGGFDGDGSDFGPLGYATQADPALNPAGIVVWGVTRGGPMRHRDTCSATIEAWTP